MKYQIRKPKPVILRIKRAKKKFKRGTHPNSHKPHQPKELPPGSPLSPNEIVRWVDGPRYFGVRHTGMQMYIKLGEIPKPVVLCGRSKGWLGSTILAWQAERAAKQSRGVN